MNHERPGTTLAKRPAMLRRGLLSASICSALALSAGPVEAAGAWLSEAPLTPVEQRVVIAATPGRTTLWTSLRFTAKAGKVALVVPAPSGSVLDISSDAWMEALEVATAPRLFPPAGGDPYCPGKAGPADVFHVEGQLGHTPSLTPQDFIVAETPAELSAWATQAGLHVSAALSASLAQLPGLRFIGVRFDAHDGAALTPTLRVVMPGAAPELPLALTQAGADDLQVTAWILGPGRGDLIGGTEVMVPPSSLVWNPKDRSSNYVEQRDAVLGADPARFLVEAAGHDPLAHTVPIAAGTASIDSVVSVFFERAAAYGDGNFDAAACLALAEVALDATEPVAASCPAGALGTVDPGPACAEAPKPGETNPAVLRCGPGADDLAVALSGLVPKGAWLTRQVLTIPAGATGAAWPIGFAGDQAQDQVLACSKVDYGVCEADGGTSSSSSSSSSTSGSGTSSGGHVGSSSSGGNPGNGGSGGEYVGPYVSPGASCTCNGSETAAAETCAAASEASGDSCSSDTAGGDSCSGDADYGDTCDSSSGGDSCSSGGGDSCSGGDADFGDACSGGGSGSCSGPDFDCSTARGHRHRPRFSILLVASLVILVPLRRHGRKRRDAERARAAGPRR